ncbi:MAG: fumarylacetoacetate hydrolase family protein [Verrucomicrobia bacterium]|nr:fumarylacetoacetate hydrolase family protein [Verrucomicrobiota bacterium]
MRIGRIQMVGGEADGQTHQVIIEDGGYRVIERGEIVASLIAPDEARLIAPVVPQQVILIGLNYAGHASETDMAPPDAPVVLFKTPNAIIGPDAPIVLPAMAPDEVDYEAELVIVIGRPAKNVSEADALDAVLGYTCGNDVSARDCQFRLDQQWARAKSFDTFAPLGPWIETELNPDDVVVRCRLNNEVMQEASSSGMLFSCARLVSYLSRCMTLWPGSVIFTGTPPGVGFKRQPPVFLRKDDRVTVEIDGIGSLNNPVARETP